MRTIRDSNASALAPARKSSNGVLSPRLFSETSPSARASKGFLIAGTRVTVRRASSIRELRWSRLIGESAEVLSLLNDMQFKSHSRRTLFRALTNSLSPPAGSSMIELQQRTAISGNLVEHGRLKCTGRSTGVRQSHAFRNRGR